MMTPGAIHPTLDKIKSTLARGNRVWILGGIEIPERSAVPLQLPPAPTSPYRWNSIVYWMSWTQHVGAVMRDHAPRREVVSIETQQPVHALENPPLLVFEGWQP